MWTGLDGGWADQKSTDRGAMLKNFPFRLIETTQVSRKRIWMGGRMVAKVMHGANWICLSMRPVRTKFAPERSSAMYHGRVGSEKAALGGEQHCLCSSLAGSARVPIAHSR